ncbi:MAG: tetratricopeptide repeat protein [candidate division WOR-3 bacterium]
MKNLFDRIEREKYSILLGFLGLFSVIFIRNILESSFEGTQTFGFSPISSRSFYMVFVHFALFYFSLFLWLLLIFYLFTKEKIEKIARVLIYGMWFIVIPPIVDILISKGSGYKLTYLKGIEQFFEIHRFFDITKDLLESSWGQRIEILLALIGGAVYIFIKTKNIFKALLVAIILYLTIFLHGALPNTIGKIPFYFGYKEISSLTIVTGNIFFIDSQNYAIIFLFLSVIPGLIILRKIAPKTFKNLFNLKNSIILIAFLLIGMIYGIYELTKYYQYLFINPLTYLVIVIAILAFQFLARLSLIEKPLTILLLIFLGFTAITIGPIFAIILATIILLSYFVQFKILKYALTILAGFAIFFQNQTFFCFLPFNQKSIESYGTKVQAWNLFLDRKYNQALKEYQKIFELNPDLGIKKFIGRCYLHLGEIDSGINYLKTIPKIDYEIVQSLGDAYTNKKDFAQAELVYYQAINKNIEPLEFLIKIAELKARTGHKAGLDRVLESAQKFGLPKFKYHQIIGDFHLFQQDYQNARYHYEKSLYYNPRSITARSGLATIFYYKKDYEQAENEFLKALKFEPKNDAIYNNLGAIYLVKRDYAKAKATFEKSIRLNPSQIEGYYNLGLIYEATGEIDEASRMYQKALTIHPQFSPAREALKRLGSNE